MRPTTNGTGREREEVIAYLIGPRKDGLILNKDGTVLDINEYPSRTKKQATESTKKQGTGKRSNDLPRQATLRPHWSKHLIAHQLGQLRKGHKMGRQKITMKVMRQIRKQHQHEKGKKI